MPSGNTIPRFYISFGFEFEMRIHKFSARVWFGGDSISLDLKLDRAQRVKLFRFLSPTDHRHSYHEHFPMALQYNLIVCTIRETNFLFDDTKTPR